MDKLRRYGEPVFWVIVVLGTLPAILSNSFIPANWFLPFTVESIDKTIFSTTARWLWFVLFVVAVLFGLYRRSFLRIIAPLPLLVLWVMPSDRIEIDFSHPEDAIYFEARADSPINTFQGTGAPDDLVGTEYNPVGRLFFPVLWLYLQLGERHSDDFGDDPEITRVQEIYSLVEQVVRADLVGDKAKIAELEVEWKQTVGENTQFDPDFVRRVVTLQPKLPAFVSNVFMSKGFITFRDDVVAQLADGSSNASQKAPVIIDYILKVETRAYAVLLSLLTLMSLICFGLLGRLRMLLAGLILLMGISYSVSIWSILPVFGAIQAFLLIAFLVFVRSFLKTNGQYFRSLGRKKNLSNFRRTLWPWSFFLLLFAGSIFISAKVNSLITDQVYEVGVPKSLPPEQQFFHVEETGEGLEADLRYAAQDHYIYLNDATSGAAIAFRDNYNDNDKTAITKTMKSLESAILPYIFGPNDFEHCLEPPDLLCPLVNEIKRAINWSYRKARQRQLDRIETALTELSKHGKEAVNSGVDTLNDTVGLAAKEASQWTVKGISALFLWYHIATTISIIFLTFVLIKSFLFIASRVYLHADEDNQNLWEEMARMGGAGVPVGREKTYVFDRQKWGTFFVRRGQSNKNIKRDISWPQWQYMILRRFATGLFALYREDWSRDHGEKFVKTTKGGEFVEWELAAGQRVVFRLQNLAAFSETVKLRSLWSFRLSHFIFGKVLFSSVEGPGMILLRTNGEPHIGTSGERFILGAAPNEHIAFDLATDFLVNSDLKLKNIYFSDIEVVANDSPRVVVDVMPEHSFTGGAARFIRAFFIPV